MVFSQYAIRLSIRPPPEMRSLDAALPSYEHEEPVHMATHERDLVEVEVNNLPALALAGPGPMMPVAPPCHPIPSQVRLD